MDVAQVWWVGVWLGFHVVDVTLIDVSCGDQVVGLPTSSSSWNRTRSSSSSISGLHPPSRSIATLHPSTINKCSSSCILFCSSSTVPHPSISTSRCTIGSPKSTSAIT